MDVVTGIALAVLTALVLVGAGVVAGFVTVVRRRGARAPRSAAPGGSAAFGFGLQTGCLVVDWRRSFFGRRAAARSFFDHSLFGLKICYDFSRLVFVLGLGDLGQ